MSARLFDHIDLRVKNRETPSAFTRKFCRPLGFLDVKVSAVDETWSGLKLMIRRENRR